MTYTCKNTTLCISLFLVLFICSCGKKDKTIVDFTNEVVPAIKYAQQGKNEEAIKEYRRLAKNGNPLAKEYLPAFLYSIKQYKEAFKIYLTNAKEGNSLAQYNLGIMHLDGKGTPQNFNKAIFWLKKAAKNRKAHAHAFTKLGELYESGKYGVDKNLPKAVGYYKEGAKNGDPLAQYKLADFYINGKYVEKDYAKALKLYLTAAKTADPARAARTAYPPALFRLFQIYDQGLGVDKNIPKALEWLQKAATAGSAKAQCVLASWYKTGTNVDKDLNKAIILYKKAANHNLVEAIYCLAVLYEEGKGVPPNYKKALSLYEKAATLGFNDAKNGYAFLCAERGIQLDKAKGYAEEALKAAPKDPFYIGTLGWVYFKQKKYKKAVSLLEKAITLFPKEETEVSSL